MDLQPRPLERRPRPLDGLSERLMASHHENNYAGAVRRSERDPQATVCSLTGPRAPVFVVNGLEARGTDRRQFRAAARAVLRRPGRRRRAAGPAACRWRWSATSDRSIAGAPSSWRWPRRWAAAPAGRCCRGPAREGRPGESLGCRPHALARRGNADPRARHVRACVPHGLRLEGGRLCRCVHQEYPVGGRPRAVRRSGRCRRRGLGCRPGGRGCRRPTDRCAARGHFLRGRRQGGRRCLARSRPPDVLEQRARLQQAGSRVLRARPGHRAVYRTRIARTRLRRAIRRGRHRSVQERWRFASRERVGRPSTCPGCRWAPTMDSKTVCHQGVRHPFCTLP